jgi:NAD(P)H-hydrate epimerase
MPEVMTAGLSETAQEEQAGRATDTPVLTGDATEQVIQLTARADAVAIGPGLTSGEHIRRFVRPVVERRTCPVIIDADGLNALAPWPADLCGTPELPLILTPHPGEMRRLIGATSDQNSLVECIRVAREFAVAHQLILVLKGARTLIAAPDGRIAINPTGNAGVGTAGAGDTLTGIITSFMAQSYGALNSEADAFAATVAAVYVAGMAADLAAQSQGMRAMVASDISLHFSAAIRLLDPVGERP